MARPRLAVGVSVAALIAAVTIQFYPPVSRENPPVSGEIRAPDAVIEIFKRSCYDCHSNETRWPWYSRIAPVSWLVVDDVDQARVLLNFSTWSELDRFSRAYNIDEIASRVRQGEMPPSRYLWMNPSARLSVEDLDTIRRWSDDPESSPPR